jgi:hypothetical protein
VSQYVPGTVHMGGVGDRGDGNCTIPHSSQFSSLGPIIVNQVFQFKNIHPLMVNEMC